MHVCICGDGRMIKNKFYLVSAIRTKLQIFKYVKEMNTQNLKDKLHKLVDEINDDATLENFYEAMNYFSLQKSKTDILDELDEEQLQRLMESVAQNKQGKTIKHEEMKKEIEQWFLK